MLTLFCIIIVAPLLIFYKTTHIFYPKIMSNLISLTLFTGCKYLTATVLLILMNSQF